MNHTRTQRCLEKFVAIPLSQVKLAGINEDLLNTKAPRAPRKGLKSNSVLHTLVTTPRWEIAGIPFVREIMLPPALGAVMARDRKMGILLRRFRLATPPLIGILRGGTAVEVFDFAIQFVEYFGACVAPPMVMY